MQTNNKLRNFYRILSTNVDSNGQTFVSTFEGKKCNTNAPYTRLLSGYDHRVITWHFEYSIVLVGVQIIKCTFQLKTGHFRIFLSGNGTWKLKVK